MKTPTNWEDNQLFREAADAAAKAAKREREIADTVSRYLQQARVALRDDFGLDDADITRRIQEHVQPMEGTPEEIGQWLVEQINQLTPEQKAQARKDLDIALGLGES